MTAPRERANATDNTKKQKLDAPFGLRDNDNDNDNNGDLTEFNDNDSHIKRDDDFIWPSNLIQLLQDIMALPCPNPLKPQFKFDLPVEAAKKNYILLMQKFRRRLARRTPRPKEFAALIRLRVQTGLGTRAYLQSPPQLAYNEDHPFGRLNLAPIAIGRIWSF